MVHQEIAKAVVRRYSIKKVLLHFINVVALNSATLLKERLWHGCFPENLAKFSRPPFLQNTSTSA